jgi:hypothetical protein
LSSRTGLGFYTQMTPVVIGTKGKTALIQGAGTSTVISYTPTTGAAFTFAASGSGISGWGQGLTDVALQGQTSGTAQGVVFGVPSNDTTGRTAQGAILADSQITGFCGQFVLSSQSWNNSINHVKFENPVLGCQGGSISAASNIANAGENISFHEVTVDRSDSNWGTDAVYLASGAVIGEFTNSNFDNAELTIGAGTVNCTDCYWENPGGGGATNTVRTSPWINLNGVMTLTGATFNDDTPQANVTQNTVIEVGNGGGGALTWSGGISFGSSPLKSFIQLDSHGQAFVSGSIFVGTRVPLIDSSASTFPWASFTSDNPIIGASVKLEANNSTTNNDAHFLSLEKSISSQ